MSSTDAGPPEHRIRQLGREILTRAAGAEPSVLRPAWWQRQLLDLAMQDERFKTQLFRFIECLPRLHDSAAVATHLRQYLTEPAGPRANGTTPHTAHPDMSAAPGNSSTQPAAERSATHAADAGAPTGPLRPLIDLATAYRRDDSAYASLVAFAARFSATRMAGTFIAGSTADEAIAVVRRLRRDGQTFTLDVLGETVLCQRDADYFGRLYLDLIDDLSDAAPGWSAVPLVDDAPWGALPRINVSVKLSAFSARFDAIAPRQAAEDVVRRLRPILIEARRRGAFVNVDLEHYAVKDLTYDIFMQVLGEPDLRDWPDIGVVVQAYLRDSERDLLRLTEWTKRRGAPITVRLVKGAYWDSETAHAREENWPIPVWTEKWESDRNFERLSRIMLDNHAWTRPAFASHNVRSLAHALAAAEQRGLPPRTIEVQMLYGMGDPLKRALADMQQRVRIYTPFGRLVPGMAYFIRRLLENTANESFLRQSFSERVPVDTLLAAPGQSATPTATAERRARPHGSVESRAAVSASPGAAPHEPASDFTHADARDRLADAIRDLERGVEYTGRIGGAAVAAARWIEHRNPSRASEVTARVGLSAAPVVDDAVAAAATAQRDWMRTPPAERRGVTRRVAAWLRTNRLAAAARLIVQLGRTWRDADAEVAAAIDAFEWNDAERHTGGEQRRAPTGVWALAASFEHPLALPARIAAAAVADGSALIWTPTPPAAGAAHLVLDALRAADCPDGLVNVLLADDAGSRRLLTHPGASFAAAAGRPDYLERVLGRAESDAGRRPALALRRSGDNTVIVDASANLDHAALGTLAAAFTYAGQRSSSCRRVVVLGGAGDEFTARLAAAAAELTVGPADDPASVVGPLIDAAALESARRWEAQLAEFGRRLTSTGPGAVHADTGWFMNPVLFAGMAGGGDPPIGDAAAPILTILHAADLDEAIAIANKSGRAAVVHLHSRTPEHIRRIRRDCRAGRVHVNRRAGMGYCDRPAVGPLCELFEMDSAADQTAAGRNAYNPRLHRPVDAAAVHASA